MGPTIESMWDVFQQYKLIIIFCGQEGVPKLKAGNNFYAFIRKKVPVIKTWYLKSDLLLYIKPW
jgi:hypothetical protein